MQSAKRIFWGHLGRFVCRDLPNNRSNFRGHLRQLHNFIALNTPIKVGDKLPSVDLFEGTPANKVNIVKEYKGDRIVIFGVPGAYTPGCSTEHLPGYLQRAHYIRTLGIDDIICVSVNDPYVMEAWSKANQAQGKVRMLADTCATFTKAIDLDIDLSNYLGTVRSKRYAMLVEDGVVKSIDVEPDDTGLSCSLAEQFVGKHIDSSS